MTARKALLAVAALNLGIGSTTRRHIMDLAPIAMTRLGLETGCWDCFRPALALDKRHGFVASAPFDTDRTDRNSLFFTRDP